ncbi:type IV pilus biogenesis protein PilM [Pseudogracilibacillus auburnensis]|uniref:Type IV pilus assembly protein PilM n=1 Tax=Pseudogracilibacillus auburnensis TaxID=1494959 RepID=A0A2V3VTV0_9BACI|nr:pilus assembly protein PilM [Pseudogracilibacillus auburnensis]MBO1003379.1 pilus assembly protein PilM [Pseudogracilibacillus auburnensis]PXW85317.1 type IV pilus assembly protein PilM [Pseudogracilibacillus auburnensis]
MFTFGKSKRVINIVIEDYVIRMVENNGKDLASMKYLAEKVLPPDTIVNGKVVDEVTFYEFMKELVREYSMKNRQVRFYVPHELIIMREITIPDHVLKNEWKQYITMEIGQSIHFPFTNPVFDLYELPDKNEQKVTILAAPEEEIIKYIEIFDDIKLKPIAVDVQALGVYRYFLWEQERFQSEKVYLFLELNLTSANISIFHQHKVEFLRFQRLNVSPNDWHLDDVQSVRWKFTGDETFLNGEMEDQLNEIDRLMNFYRFSIHRGEKAVTDIILLGDIPELDHVKTKLKERYELPVTPLTVKNLHDQEVSREFIPALGLALKGGK